MRCACIDIGSNTTRLLVADTSDGLLTPVLELRAFTRLGRACRAGGELPSASVEALAAVVAEQAAAAGAAGARAVRIVATAAVRRAVNAAEVCARLRAAAGGEVELLSGEQEARLAFAGATWALRALDEVGERDPIGVADVGGGSSELVVGTLAGGVTWSRSLPLGSGDLAESHLHADPPGAPELGAIRDAVAAAFADVEVPSVTRAVAVGGSATSLRRLVGPRLDAEGLARAVATLASRPAAALAVERALDPERVRLLPAGLLVLAAVVARMGPLTVAEGGLREGVVLELAAGLG